MREKWRSYMVSCSIIFHFLLFIYPVPSTQYQVPSSFYPDNEIFISFFSLLIKIFYLVLMEGCVVGGNYNTVNHSFLIGNGKLYCGYKRVRGHFYLWI